METMAAYRKRLRERKARYNLTFFPSDVRRMDDVAHRLGISRSELLTFCFNFVEATQSLDESLEGDG